jgi:hypothetical protein
MMPVLPLTYNPHLLSPRDPFLECCHLSKRAASLRVSPATCLVAERHKSRRPPAPCGVCEGGAPCKWSQGARLVVRGHWLAVVELPGLRPPCFCQRALSRASRAGASFSSFKAQSDISLFYTQPGQEPVASNGTVLKQNDPSDARRSTSAHSIATARLAVSDDWTGLVPRRRSEARHPYHEPFAARVERRVLSEPPSF